MSVQRYTPLLVVLMVVWLGSLSASEAKDQSFTLAIQNRKVTGDVHTIRVQQGDRVMIHWTTDETVTIHLHGYDIEQVVQPGTPAVFDFKAYATGRFPVVAHGFGAHGHGQSHRETPLVYVEVRP